MQPHPTPHPKLQALMDSAVSEFGPWCPLLVVEQDRIGNFAFATGDNQWIHSDPERAAHGPFGKTVAQGQLVESIIAELLRKELGHIDELCGGGVMYAGRTSEVLWRVCAGDAIQARGHIATVTPNKTRTAKLDYDYEIQNDGEKLIAKGTLKFLCIVR